MQDRAENSWPKWWVYWARENKREKMCANLNEMLTTVLQYSIL